MHAHRGYLVLLDGGAGLELRLLNLRSGALPKSCMLQGRSLISLILHIRRFVVE
jgi:hypothetical protein